MTGLFQQPKAPKGLTSPKSSRLAFAFLTIFCLYSQDLHAGPSSTQSVVVSSPESSIRAGEVASFTAQQGNKAVIGGVWSVLGGSANGTIDTLGNYHAPLSSPLMNPIWVAYLFNNSAYLKQIVILSPVPVITSASSQMTTGQSMQITVTGTGFLRGSTIMVNGISTATIYVDASHLSAAVPVAQTPTNPQQVSVSNPPPGAVLSNGVHVVTAPSLATPPSPIVSLNTPPYFMEQSDEFAGPFPSWTNVKTAFGVVGDGVTDDTAAIQRAFNSITSSATSCVLWFPAGTYKITSTLTLGHMAYFSIIGEDPTTTTLKWGGAQGGTMLLADGSTWFKISRLSLDGNGTAEIAEDLTAIKDYQTSAYYSTYNELSDQHIRGANVGIHLGVDAETTVERVFFDHLPTAGLAVGTFNTLNVFVNDSLFVECGTGLTDTYQNGAGSFVVSNSFFVRSQVADMSIANTGLFTARHNGSMGSKTFFLSYEIYDSSSTVTLQNNTVLDPQTTPFQFGNLGPFTLIDNVVRVKDATIPIIEASWSPASLKDVFSMGNTYTPNGGIGTGSLAFQGRVVSYDDTTVPVSAIADIAVPANVYVPPNLHRSVFETSAKTGAAVQQAINLAKASGSPRPVVHLSKGIYAVSSTIVFPSGSDIQLIGDDAWSSSLTWNGAPQSSVLAIPTSNVSVRNLRVDGPGEAVGDGIRLTIADQPNTQVIVDQASLGLKNSYSVNFDALEHANAEMFSTYTTGSVTGVRVTGGAYRAANQGTLGTTNHYTGSLQSEGTSTSFDVSAGGKYMVQDNWHDLGASSPQNFRLSGTGTVTEQGGSVFMTSATPLEIDNFSGNVTLMGFSFTGGFNLASTSGHANLLNLGLVGNSATYLPTSTPNVTVGNVLNSFSGGHIAQTVNPDLLWMRGMLAQTRSEYPIRRPAMAAGGNRIRLDRIFVNSTASAIHLMPDSIKAGLYYVLRSGLSNLSNTSGSCVATTFSDANDQWLIMAAGEGDFEVVSKSTGKALAMGTSAGYAPVLEPLTGLYEQRWMLGKLGTGDFTLTNRQSGTLLSLPTQGGCVGSAGIGATNWTISAY